MDILHPSTARSDLINMLVTWIKINLTLICDYYSYKLIDSQKMVCIHQGHFFFLINYHISLQSGIRVPFGLNKKIAEVALKFHT